MNYRKSVLVYFPIVLKIIQKNYCAVLMMFFLLHIQDIQMLRLEDLNKHPDIKVLVSSPEAGAFIMCADGGRQIMVTGHLEYEAQTLAEEYQRDLDKGLDINVPENYFPNDNPEDNPLNRWRSHAHLLFSNWLNYYVYQLTPYEWD